MPDLMMGLYGSVAGGAPAWTPALLSNLAVWVDASDTSTTFQDSALTTPASANNDPVGGWKDKSGNNRHFLQATSGKRPLLKTAAFNGLNGIQGDVVDDQLVNTYTEVAVSTWYFVMQVKAQLVSSKGLYMASSVRVFLEETATKGYSIYAGSSLDSFTAPPAGYTIITAIVTWNGASSTYETQGTTRATGNPGSSFGSNLQLLFDGTHSSDARLLEIAVQESVGSASDKTSWRTYCASKWNSV